MKPLDIIEVYESVSDTAEGDQYGNGTYWETHHLAQEASKSTLGPAKPISHQAVRLDDGRIWVLSGKPSTLFKSIEHAKKQAALNKLTPEERRLLGVG